MSTNIAALSGKVRLHSGRFASTTIDHGEVIHDFTDPAGPMPSPPPPPPDYATTATTWEAGVTPSQTYPASSTFAAVVAIQRADHLRKPRFQQLPLAHNRPRRLRMGYCNNHRAVPAPSRSRTHYWTSRLHEASGNCAVAARHVRSAGVPAAVISVRWRLAWGFTT